MALVIIEYQTGAHPHDEWEVMTEATANRNAAMNGREVGISNDATIMAGGNPYSTGSFSPENSRFD